MYPIFLLQYQHNGLHEEFPFQAENAAHALKIARQHTAEAGLTRSATYPRLARLNDDDSLLWVAGPPLLVAKTEI